ncbi:hypothetical protein ACHAWF_005476 [Thalassiosira exigua]
MPLQQPNSIALVRRSARTRARVLFALLFVPVFGSMYLSHWVLDNIKHDVEPRQDPTKQEHPGVRENAKPNESITALNIDAASPTQLNHDKCAFRSYPSTRLYGLSSKPQPKFLSETAYIRGQWPIIINPTENDETPGGKNSRQSTPVKVCLDTTSWENLIDKDGKERLPFTDGHNPSVVSLAPNPYGHERLDPAHLKPLASGIPQHDSLESLFLGVTIFGGGQCKFGFSPGEVDDYRFSQRDDPTGGKRTVVAVLAPQDSAELSPFQTIAQATLLLERDEKYGTSRRRAIQPEKSNSGFARMHQEFDDPRLFFHLGMIWILYRNGPLFGYNDQIHNPIHFEEASPADIANGAKFVAYVKASETVRVGGGRNIALISEEPTGRKENGDVEWASNPSLKALTWVDPVTVRDDIKTQVVEAKLNARRLLESGLEIGNKVAQTISPMLSDRPLSEHHHSTQHRRLGSKPSSSNIHGTNGYMVPLSSSGELFGIAHFHRPENRKSSQFALHGHHYTHVFFTIARQDDGNANDVASRPFKLRRLSNEFVFRTNSIPAGHTHPPADGDIIQFASGLDVVGSDVDGQLILSYGINDCEGGVITLSMVKIQEMLLEVDPGQEVVDLMEYAKK